MKKISIRDCIESHTCWPVSRLEDYAKQHGGGEEIPVQDILDDEMISVVDKMWIVITAGLLTEDQMHNLAVIYAEHALTEANTYGWDALEAKRDWLMNKIDHKDLKFAENAAWEEGRVYPMSKGAACAAKTCAEVALRGAAVAAGGWFGGDINSDEKLWQWRKMREFLR